MLREVSDDLQANVAVMLDTKGVEIRTGRIENGLAQLKSGERFTLYSEERLGSAGRTVCAGHGIDRTAP